MAETKRDRRAKRHSAARVARGRASSRSGTHTPQGRGGAGAGEPPRGRERRARAEGEGGGRVRRRRQTGREGGDSMASAEGESGGRVRRASAERQCKTRLVGAGLYQCAGRPRAKRAATLHFMRFVLAIVLVQHPSGVLYFPYHLISLRIDISACRLCRTTGV